MIRTRSQALAARSFKAVEGRCRSTNSQKEYLAFTRSFPTLLHTCGLAQATAYAQAKGNHHVEVLEDVAETLGLDVTSLTTDAREIHLRDYIVLSRQVLQAASWVKRYAEALLSDQTQPAAKADTPEE